MNWFDLLVGILLLIAFIYGYRKGLIMQLVGLATLVLAAIFGGRLAGKILPEVDRLTELPSNVARVLSFILAFVLIAVVLSLIGRLIQQFIHVVFLSFINRLLGSVITVGTMILLLSIILNLVLMLDKNNQVISRKIREESFFFHRVEAVVPIIVPYMDKEFWEEHVPKNYREELERKADSIYQSLPEGNRIDSMFQQRHFNVN